MWIPFFHSRKILMLIFQTFLTFKIIHNQFYNIYPATPIVPNYLPLNSSVINFGAFLALSVVEGEKDLVRTSADVICIECQKLIINDNPDLLPDMKIDVLYYSTSAVNTSQASIAALEYSLTPTHIATLGNKKFKFISKD